MWVLARDIETEDETLLRKGEGEYVEGDAGQVEVAEMTVAKLTLAFCMMVAVACGSAERVFLGVGL